MDDIVKELTERGLTSSILDAYLLKLREALSEAYNAAENDQDYVAMTKVGEAHAHMDMVMSVWKKLTENQK